MSFFVQLSKKTIANNIKTYLIIKGLKR